MVRLVDRTLKTSSALLATFVKVDPDRVWSFAQPVVRPIVLWAQSGLIIPAFLLATPVVAWCRSRLENARLDDVHILLDQFRDEVFKNETPELAQHRRVTLFRHKALCWRYPFVGGFLVPIERSGTFTRKTSATFRAPDDGEDCEGIVGRAFGKGATVAVESLDDLLKDSSPGRLSRYAEQTFMKERRVKEYIRRRKPLPRSIVAMPIEVSAQPWGVLVFDSTGETINKKAAEAVLKKHNKTLTGYLKGL